MKRIIFILLAVSVVASVILFCNVKKEQSIDYDKIEQDAINAGRISKKELTIELKEEVNKFLKDIAEFDISDELASNVSSASIVDIDFMLPVNEVSKLNTNTQKARATGMYFTDLQILRLTHRSTTAVEANLQKLCQELDILYAIDIINKKAPIDVEKEELRQFISVQKDTLMKALIDNGKIDVVFELFGGMVTEYACLWASPAMVINPNIVSPEINKKVIDDLVVLQQITANLVEYYPDLEQLGAIISPLKNMVGSVEQARKSQKEINEIRTNLLK